MKTLLRSLFPLFSISAFSFFFTACAQPGIRDYNTGTVTRADGTTSSVSTLGLAITGDIVGAKSIPTSRGPIEIDTSIVATRRVAILNKAKTEVIGYTEETIVPGFYVSEANRSLGDAFSKSVRSIGSVIGTTLAGFAGIEAANAAGGALGTVSTAVKP
jgi:hypothetical protein